MLELTWAVAWLHAAMTGARARHAVARATRTARRRATAQAAGGRPTRPAAWAQVARDVGAGIVETVVIIGLFVAAAIVIVAILVAKARGAADNVKTQ